MKLARAYASPETKRDLLLPLLKHILECEENMDHHPLAPLILDGRPPLSVPIYDDPFLARGKVRFLYDDGAVKEVTLTDAPTEGLV